MGPLVTLPEAIRRFGIAATAVRTAYAHHRTDADQPLTPAQLVEQIDKFLILASNMDREEGETAAVVMDDVARLGDHGLALLADLAAWAQHLGLADAVLGIGATSLATANWIIRHHGRIRSPESLVNALAALANRTADTRELEQMAQFMGDVIRACDDVIRQDMEKNNPGRPWRLLHLNRGIVATRSHNLALMVQVFDDLISDLPEEAPGFFEQGMQQMEALDYPASVRQLMAQYHAAWSHPTLH